MDQILVPVDGSDPARNALHYACEQYPNATITAIHVVNPDMVYATGAGGMVEADEQATTHAEPILENAEEIAEEYGVDLTTEWRVGPAVGEILSAADEMGAECIVIGTHGRTGVERVVLGSVAERVARHATIPITIVSD